MVLKIIIFLFLAARGFAQNLLANPDFEDPFWGSDWRGFGARITPYNLDSFSGSHSVKISNAFAQWSSIEQTVSLEPDTLYAMSVMVKLLSQTNPALGERVEIHFKVLDGGEAEYLPRGHLPNLRVQQGWQPLSADFRTGSNVYNIMVNIRSNVNVEYLLDSASLTVIPTDPDWRLSAEARIEQLRMNDITINIEVPADYEEQILQLHVRQVKHDFPFGSAVRDSVFSGTSPDSELYRNTFFSNFNWAVVENRLKWAYAEPTEGTLKFPDHTIDMLTSHGIPIRGHSVFWGIEREVPLWLRPLQPWQIWSRLRNRIDTVVSRYDNRLAHWDVCNEQENHKWFESHTGDPHIGNWMFRRAKARAPNTTLFLNDFHVIAGGRVLQSYVNTARSMLVSGVPVGGFGIQGHFAGAPDIQAVAYRLDKAAEVGLPIWITELDVLAQDEVEKAESYDDLVTLFFSHPAVQGVMLWGFVDMYHWKPDAALFEGPEYMPNAAGLRWQEMVGARWMTNRTLPLFEGQEQLTLRGYYGAYEAQVVLNGEVIQTETFHLQTGFPVTVDITVN